MKKNWLLMLCLCGVACLVVLSLRLSNDVILQSLNSYAGYWSMLVKQRYVCAMILYVAGVATAIMLGLPAVMPLSLLAGMLFGVWLGTIYVLLGITCGSALSFLTFRYLFSAFIKRRYASRLQSMVERINAAGLRYVLMLYFSSVVPLVVINAVAAISSIPFRVFLFTASLGSFPLVVLFTMSGNRLGAITSVYDIFTPEAVMIFVLLVLICLAPVIVGYIVNPQKDRKV